MNHLNQPTFHSSQKDLKRILIDEGAEIRKAHFEGASGIEIVERRTFFIDDLLRQAHSRLAASGPLPSIIAVGGYGRGELNPYSDIDIMFLCRDESDRKGTPELLYLLWDSGMDMGYSVRTVSECVSLAREDIKVRTSLMESRLIAGDGELYKAFLSAMTSEVFYWKPSEFISEKLSERSATRLKYGGSIYLREPNLKEGEGGLRDIHTVFWMVFVRFRVRSLGDLVPLNIISETQYRVFLRSRNFLWHVRNEIHYLSNRKNDHLTFDLQEQTARDFHYRDSADLLAVERFMKSYFMHARNIREFSSLVTEAVLPKAPRRWFDRKVVVGSFSLVGKTLLVNNVPDCRGDAGEVLKAFQLVQTRSAVFSEKLRNLVRSCRIDDHARGRSAASEVFLAILNEPQNLADTLTLMKDLRFLGRYIPEFRAIQALARHDYYHLYAVDEHILLAIRNLEKLWSGQFPSLAILRDAFAGLRKRWLLTLTVLLHDLGKAYRTDHEQRGVGIAETVLGRLGIKDADRDRVLFLIRNHLIMSTLSQRRELNDVRVIAGFARIVGDRENLAMLYLLTYADISAVNPTSWTQWKAVLLQELYLKTLTYFDSSAQAAEESQSRLIRASGRIRSAAEGLFSPEEIDTFLVSMPDQYILYTSVQRVIDHLSMLRRLSDEKLVIQYRHYPEKGFTELSVCAYDAYGMFYRTAGAIASKNLSILRAQVYTSRMGVMIDTFQITDPEGRLYAYDEAWESLREELSATLMKGRRIPEPGQYAAARQLPGTVVASVEFDNLTSDSFTIIDITGRDRVGFLYKVTKTLYELNLDIASAKIVTEGARVMDAFYVTDMLRRKILDDRRLRQIRETLLSVIQ